VIKRKSLVVILISSLVISAVLVLTIIGFSLYLGWKGKDLSKTHSLEIAGLNASLYGQHINVSGLSAKKGREGIYKDKFLIEGAIKNTGFRTVGSLMLQVDFLNASHEIIRSETFKPLASSLPPSKTSIAALSIFVSGKELPLAPGKSVVFKHILSSQKDKDVISPIKFKRYATNPNEWSGKFGHRITMVKF